MPGLTMVATAVLAAAAQGAEVRAPVTRDNWVSNVGPEADGNNGGAPRLKLKSCQEMSLIDIDPAPLKGRVVEKAALEEPSSYAPMRMTA